MRGKLLPQNQGKKFGVRDRDFVLAGDLLGKELLVDLTRLEHVLSLEQLAALSENKYIKLDFELLHTLYDDSDSVDYKPVGVDVNTVLACQSPEGGQKPTATSFDDTADARMIKSESDDHQKQTIQPFATDAEIQGTNVLFQPELDAVNIVESALTHDSSMDKTDVQSEADEAESNLTWTACTSTRNGNLSIFPSPPSIFPSRPGQDELSESTGFLVRDSETVEKTNNGDLNRFFSFPVIVYRCDPCDKSFGKASQFQEHVSSVHSKEAQRGPHKSDQCHIDTVHHKSKPYKCLHCGETFRCADRVVSYVRAAHSEDKGEQRRHTCDQCDKSYSEAYQLRRHIDAVHHKLRRYKCEQCGKTFAYAHHLVSHVRAAHSDDKREQRRHTCDQCDKSYSEAYRLRRHIDAVHHKLRRYKCEQCGKTFAYAHRLVSHVNAVHHKLRRYKCEQCGKTFAYAHHLVSHARAAHSDDKREQRRHTCDQCDKSYSEAYRLRRHIDAVHHKLRPYKCEQCGKTFAYAHHLVPHVNVVHRGLRLFPCDSCGKMFGQSSNLQKHVKSVHQKLRLYQCPVCETKFPDAHNLRRHVRSVHDVLKPHKCERCSKRFSRLDHLKSHSKGVHQSGQGKEENLLTDSSADSNYSDSSESSSEYKEEKKTLSALSQSESLSTIAFTRFRRSYHPPNRFMPP